MAVCRCLLAQMNHWVPTRCYSVLGCSVTAAHAHQTHAHQAEDPAVCLLHNYSPPASTRCCTTWHSSSCVCTSAGGLSQRVRTTVGKRIE